MVPFKPVKVGILGCGSTSGAYLSRLKKYPLVELYACADLEIYRAEARAEQYKIPRVYVVDELLEDKKVQLVVNLTPAAIHGRTNLSILLAGKHLYSERPLALHREEARNLLAEGQARHLLLGSAPDTFLGGGLQTCRQLLDAGAIGEPVAAVAFMGSRGPEHWHPAPEAFYQAGGGPMVDSGFYYLSALVSLLGPVTRVSCSCRSVRSSRTISTAARAGVSFPVQIPTHYSATLDFNNGVIATVLQSYDVTDHHLPHLEIYGTEGVLSLPDPDSYDGPVRIRRTLDAEWTEVALTHVKGIGRGVGVADLAYALASKRRHRANEQLAFHLLDILLACDESSQMGQHIKVGSTCERPAPLPPGLALHELDL